MISDDIKDATRWYVVHTHPKQEDRAESNLKVWQVETFAPRQRQRRYNQFTGAPVYVTKPLFPRYIFARFNVNDLLHKIRFTRGVHSIVSFGGIPTPIDDYLIALIQSQKNEDGFINLGAELKSGDEVEVKGGPFKGFAGVFERKMKDAERVMILLKTVSYQSHIVLERELIDKKESAYR